MPKNITAILDPERRRKKKRKKRKVDYTELLQPPVIPSKQCPHTKRNVDTSSCSQCLGATPSVVRKPVTVDWWLVDADDLDLELDLDVNIDIDSIPDEDP